MKSRKQFPQFLNSHNLCGEGVEIGVQCGNFSAYILTHWNGKKLYSIDPWKHQDDKMALLDISNEEQNIHESNYRKTLVNLQPFGARSEIIREFSISAAKRFQDNSLDFVYIDARHDYRSVQSDLAAWYPKIMVGGILAGHDYKDSFVRNNLVEVKRAVTHFSLIHTLTVNETTEDNLPSWYIFKP